MEVLINSDDPQVDKLLDQTVPDTRGSGTPNKDTRTLALKMFMHLRKS